MDEPPWIGRARIVVVWLAVFGLASCLVVAQNSWDDWGSRPSWPSVALDLGVLALGTVFALAFALQGSRWRGVPGALALLVWGWFGTWAYGFSWVPGAAALLGCALPRPPQKAAPASDVAAPAC